MLPGIRPVINGSLKHELKEIHPLVYGNILSQAQLLISKKAGVITAAGWHRDPDIAEMRLVLHTLPEWDWHVDDPVVRYEAVIALQHPLRDREDIIVHGPFAGCVNSAVYALRNDIFQKNQIFDQSDGQTRNWMDLEWLSRRITPAYDGVTSGATWGDVS